MFSDAKLSKGFAVVFQQFICNRTYYYPSIGVLRKIELKLTLIVEMDVCQRDTTKNGSFLSQGTETMIGLTPGNDMRLWTEAKGH